MLTFLDVLQETSDDFVFKGGNFLDIKDSFSFPHGAIAPIDDEGVGLLFGNATDYGELNFTGPLYFCKKYCANISEIKPNGKSLFLLSFI